MKITFHNASDTLFVEFKEGVSDTQRLLDANTVAEFDGQNELLFISMKNASKRVDVSSITFAFPQPQTKE